MLRLFCSSGIDSGKKDTSVLGEITHVTFIRDATRQSGGFPWNEATESWIKIQVENHDNDHESSDISAKSAVGGW